MEPKKPSVRVKKGIYLLVGLLCGTFGIKLPCFMSLVSFYISGTHHKKPLCKIPLFHLTYLCGNFLERHTFCIVLGESPETIRKLCLSTKFLHQEIRWNYGIVNSTSFSVVYRWVEKEKSDMKCINVTDNWLLQKLF